VHGVDERGHTVLRRRISRSQVRAVLAQLPCYVVIAPSEADETCRAYLPITPEV